MENIFTPVFWLMNSIIDCTGEGERAQLDNKYIRLSMESVEEALDYSTKGSDSSV